MKPDRQEHCALWFSVLQMASEVQGFLLLHGLIQARLMQACVGGHTESDVQPISTGSPVSSLFEVKK